jgi:hypothetical protein
MGIGPPDMCETSPDPAISPEVFATTRQLLADRGQYGWPPTLRWAFDYNLVADQNIDGLIAKARRMVSGSDVLGARYEVV